MKYITLSQVHAEAMHDPEYRAAYETEEASDQLRETLASWREEAGLTSAQVAERMGIKPSTISRMEKNASRMSIMSGFNLTTDFVTTGFTLTHALCRTFQRFPVHDFPGPLTNFTKGGGIRNTGVSSRSISLSSSTIVWGIHLFHQDTQLFKYSQVPFAV